MVYGTLVITHDNFTEQMPEFEVINVKITGGFYIKNNVISFSNSIEDWLSNNVNRQFTRDKYFEKIGSFFNLNYQTKVIKNILAND